LTTPSDPESPLMAGLEGIVLIYHQLNRGRTRRGSLTPEERYAIRAASLASGLPMTVVRKNTGYPKGSLSRVTGKLEENGLVQKSIDGANGRYRVLRATRKGKEVLSRLDQRAFQMFKSQEAELSGRIRELLDLLNQYSRSAASAQDAQQSQPPEQKGKSLRSRKRNRTLPKGQTFLFPDGSDTSTPN